MSLAKAHKQTRKHVEDHFDKLIKALTERRDQILQKVDLVFTQEGILILLYIIKILC